MKARDTKDKIVWTLRKILDSPEENFLTGCKELASLKNNADEVAACLKEEFRHSTAHNKLHLLNVVNQILFDTMQEGKEYVKSFGDNLSDLINEMANTVNVVEFLENSIRILHMWEDKKIFAPKFMEKMRKLLLNKKVQIFETQEAGGAKGGAGTGGGPQPVGALGALSAKQRISRAQIRDYNLVNDNAYTKQAFEIKQLEQNYDKNVPRIDEISKNVENVQTMMQSFNRREIMNKLTEWKNFLQGVKSEVADGLIRSSNFCLTLSKINEDEYLNLLKAASAQD